MKPLVSERSKPPSALAIWEDRGDDQRHIRWSEGAEREDHEAARLLEVSVFVEPGEEVSHKSSDVARYTHGKARAQAAHVSGITRPSPTRQIQAPYTAARPGSRVG